MLNPPNALHLTQNIPGFTQLLHAQLQIQIDFWNILCFLHCSYCVCTHVYVCVYPQYVSLQLELTGRCRVHEAQQCTHIIIPTGRQDQLLDDEQCMFSTLAVLHNIVNTTSTAKLSEESWKAHRKRDIDLVLQAHLDVLTGHSDTRKEIQTSVRVKAKWIRCEEVFVNGDG